MISHYGPLGVIAKRAISRLFRFHILEEANRHAEVILQLSKLEERLQSLEQRPLEADLRQLTLRLQTFESARMQTERNVESLRLSYEEESADAGSHRSYAQRELERNARSTNVNRERFDGAIEAILVRIMALERTFDDPTSTPEWKETHGECERSGHVIS